MFDFLKNFLRKNRGAESDYADQIPSVRTCRPAATMEPPARAHREQPPERAAARNVEVPMRPILDGLPLELQPSVINHDIGDAAIAVPLEKILAQLSKGCVRITFAELRRAAPGVFSDDDSRDAVHVALPLGEILSRLNPALIMRRRAQRQVEVPQEIASPFDKEGQNQPFGLEAMMAPAQVHELPHTATRFGSKPPLPTGPGKVSLPPVHTPTAEAPLPARGSMVSSPTPPAPAAIPFSPAAMPPSRAFYHPGNGHGAPTPEAAPKPVDKPMQMARTPEAVAQAPAAPAPQPPTPPPTPSAAPTPAPAPASPCSTEHSGEMPLMVSLTSLADTWPDAVRRDIVELRLVDAKVALPFDAIGQALKQGRIIFPWRVIRSWLVPASQPVTSPHDGQALELPLKVVAPIYLLRQQQLSKPQEKVKIDEDIPNLFFGFPQTDPSAPIKAGAASARPEDTNFYVWDDVSDAARVDESETKRSPSPGTRFVSKYATPNEVVSRAAGMDGVAGALIALPDGLMVASQLPSDVNGETLAAFLPQIFGKVSQCTKELRMGDLNNLNFTVGNVPWKIFRVNAIFFAAFGRSGEPLPTGQLAALAAELDHKPRN